MARSVVAGQTVARESSDRGAEVDGGTFEPERERPRYGLTRNIQSFNPVYAAFHEFAAVLRDAFTAGSWRDAVGFLLRPPGWRPDGSGATASDLKRSAGLVPG